MKILRSVFLIINYKTFIITILSIAATWGCFQLNYRADFPLTLIGIAIVFPVVFSIDSAYKRRERALTYISEFKAHSLCLYLSAKDWVKRDEKFCEDMKNDLIELYDKLQKISIKYKAGKGVFEKEIYPVFSKLSDTIQKFRGLGLPAGEVSRVNQYQSKINVSMENLRVILDYRTPVTLRAYSLIFIYSFPILYAPYFVYASETYSKGLEYMMPIVFSFILVSLDNIQDHLENPFDQLGEDDIQFNVDEFKNMLTKA